MLQYSVLYCNRLQEAKLYRNTKLYCDSGLGAGRWLGAQAGCWACRRQARGRQAAARGARGACAARARPGRWARGLALGSALGALGPFSIRFDSFFFPESPNEHCLL